MAFAGQGAVGNWMGRGVVTVTIYVLQLSRESKIREDDGCCCSTPHTQTSYSREPRPTGYKYYLF